MMRPELFVLGVLVTLVGASINAAADSVTYFDMISIVTLE